MRCFASQQTTQDYARHVEGLNTFRTYTLDPAVRYAEAYHHIPAEGLQARLAQSAIPTRMGVRDAYRAEGLLRAAEASAAQLQAQAQQQSAAVAELAQAHRDLLNSRSWRWTRPLRWLAARLSRRP
jgi:cell division septum initiation protein DivIVA